MKIKSLINERRTTRQQELKPNAIADESGTHPSFYSHDLVSKEYFYQLCGTSDLESVKYLEVTLDQRISIHHILDHLPSLRQLKLDQSPIASIRELGPNVKHLTTISVSGCGLSDLDGVGSLVSIKEMRVSFNSIQDLTPLALHETLEILDLSHNLVSNIVNCEILGTCSKLFSLDLRHNPISHTKNIRRIICHSIPQLRVLDGKHTEPTDFMETITDSNSCAKCCIEQVDRLNQSDSLVGDLTHADQTRNSDGLSHGSFVIAGNTARSILRLRKTNKKIDGRKLIEPSYDTNVKNADKFELDSVGSIVVREEVIFHPSNETWRLEEKTKLLTVKRGSIDMETCEQESSVGSIAPSEELIFHPSNETRRLEMESQSTAVKYGGVNVELWLDSSIDLSRNELLQKCIDSGSSDEDASNFQRRNERPRGEHRNGKVE